MYLHIYIIHTYKLTWMHVYKSTYTYTHIHIRTDIQTYISGTS